MWSRTDPLDPLDAMTEREIFDAALAIADPDERDAFLNAACENEAMRSTRITFARRAHAERVPRSARDRFSRH